MLALSAVATLAALLLAGWAISGVLARFVIAGLDQRLDSELAVLASTVAPDGRVSPAQVRQRVAALERGPDWQWRIVGPHGQWSSDDFPILTKPRPPAPPPPPPPAPEAIQPPAPPAQLAEGISVLDGHDEHHRRVHARQLTLTTSAGQVTITAAAPQAVIERPLQAAVVPLLATLAALGALLALALLVQLRLGLRPLRRLRAEVAAIRTGAIDAVDEDQPAELQPLATELNALTRDNRAALAAARLSAANLAHALKTPVAALALECRDDPARARQVARIDATIRHHLARARSLATDRRAATAVGPVVTDLVATVGRLHARRGLRFIVDAGVPMAVQMDSNDLTELVGNVLDNAARHACGEVRISAAADATDARRVRLTIDDDGPGIPAADRDRVLAPGLRLDQQEDGYGFGLTIAAELTRLYGGTIALDESPAGGLRVTLDLPATPQA